MNKKIAKAVELLESGKFSSVNEVVKEAGFPSREAMKNAFARHGLRSPINYLNVAPVSAKAATHPKADAVSADGLPELKKWCTPAQERAIDSLIKHGSITAAAEALKTEPAKLRRWLSEAKRRAARAGWSPEHDMVKPVPDGFHVKGTSTYYDKDGIKKGQWVKTKADEEHRVQMLLDALEKAIEPRKGCLEPIKAPKQSNSDLLVTYPVGDAHTGLYCWGEEVGEDFDLKIAEKLLSDAVDHLVALAPAAENALLINIGDFYHADNSLSRTMRSNHQLDTDTRWSRVLQVGIRMMQRTIDRALEKHKRVTVINEIGNHDDHTSILLSVALSSFYHNEPRVTIDCSPSPFHWYRFGRCLIGTTHGDGPKLHQLPGIMAADKPVDWGETAHRHWYTGHVHSMNVVEYPGVVCESLRTLSPRDAWANRSGYRSGRSMRCDVWHKEHGIINSHTVGVEQLNSKKK